MTQKKKIWRKILSWKSIFIDKTKAILNDVAIKFNMLEFL